LVYRAKVKELPLKELTAEKETAPKEGKKKAQVKKPTGENIDKKKRPKTARKEKGKEALDEKSNAKEPAPKSARKPEKSKVYINPMEIKETRTFKRAYDQYRYGEWRKQRPSVYVTLETDIPEIPEKMLEKPDEKARDTKLKEIDAKIKDINKALEAKKTSFDELLAAKKSNGAPVQTREIGQM